MPDSDFGYANTIEGICERITTNLKDDVEDQTNERWSKTYIQAIAGDCMKMFAFLDPDLFADNVEFEACHNEKGVYPIPQDACEQLVSIDTVIDDIGRHVQTQKAQYDILQRTAFLPTNCPHCKSGKMGTPVAFSVAKNPKNSREFRMNPKVPMGTTVTICATCTNVAQYVDDPSKEIDCQFQRFIPALHQWVLYVMYSGEPGYESAAETARITFFDLVPFTIEQVQRAGRRARQRQFR